MNPQKTTAETIDFERIEKSFTLIALNPSLWQRRLLLDKTAPVFGHTRSSFRQAFELWQLEQQGGRHEN